MTNRREFAKSLIVASTAALIMPRLVSGRSTLIALQRPSRRAPAEEDPSTEVPRILARIKPPVFPSETSRSSITVQ